MRMKLVFKLLACYIIIVGVFFITMHTLVIPKLRSHFIEERKLTLFNEANLISDEFMVSYYKYDTPLKNIQPQLKSIDVLLDTHIMIINRDGYIISNTRMDDSQRLINIHEYDNKFLDESFSENVELEGLIDEPSMSVMLPVSHDMKVQGYIVLFSSRSFLEERMDTYIHSITRLFFILSCIILIVFLFIYLFTVCPLNKVIKAAKKYASGDYQYTLSLHTNDEYESLSIALSYMASELNNLDDYRKNFIANISHDFRSPLTSIKGYAKAILDGTIPSEMQDKYLGIILFETERLTKLTANLLELNSYENQKVWLDISTFDINKIIKKIAESFEGICNKKHITLQLIFAENNTFVEADTGKIQQVLYNLLDNALKFSNPDSKIKISTNYKGEKVFISIKDYGIGIPNDAIIHIWERFYKSDTSRGKDKKGTGLGLSITREIITAHGENINVISTVGVGSEFIFSLSKHQSH